MRAIILATISAYQRYISPHKGFCCAYRAHTGRQSCSALGFRAVRRYGAILGLSVLRHRLYLCGVAHRRYSVPRRPHFRSQQGFCDIGGCDLPCDANCDFLNGHTCSSLGDFANFCDCGSCDWPDRKRKRNNDEQYVYIPPKSAK